MDDQENAGTMGGKFVRLTDESGGSYEVFHHSGLILPCFFTKLPLEPDEILKKIREFKYEKGDIMICAYPKSGNHWFLNMVNCLIAPNPVDQTNSINVDLLEYSVTKNRLERPRVLISHLPATHLPVDHFKNCGKIILLLRNPKDLVVSYWYHHIKDRFLGCTLSWQGFLKHFMEGNLMYGSYFKYLRQWRAVIQRDKYPNIICVYYEDLIEQPFQELQKVQNFLGLACTSERLKQVIDKCSFTMLKADVDSGRLKTLLKDNNRKPFIFRKGAIGDWMNHFTVSQDLAFNELINAEMKDSMFHFQYQPRYKPPKHRL